MLCGKTRQDMIRNDNIRGKDRVAPIVEKMWKLGVGGLGM